MNLLPNTQIFKIVSSTIGLKNKRDADEILVITTHVLKYLKDNCLDDINAANIFDSIFAVFDYYNDFIYKNCLNLPMIEEEEYEKIKEEYLEAEKEAKK